MTEQTSDSGDVLTITAYRLNEEPRSRITPGEPQRDWMNDSHNRFAYRCLPLGIANQTGWDITCPASFSAIWTGGRGTNAIRIEFYDEPSTAVSSHFGEGVLTFSIDYLFRTSPGHNLWVKGPTNSPKDGIAPLEGVVETDWLPFSFTMNWKFTRHHHPVHFSEGESICRIVPFPRGYASSFEARERDLEEDPELAEQFKQWASSRREFSENLKNRDPNTVNQGWQRDYTLGRDKAGKAFEFHETRVRLAPFVREK